MKQIQIQSSMKQGAISQCGCDVCFFRPFECFFIAAERSHQSDCFCLAYELVLFAAKIATVFVWHISS